MAITRLSGGLTPADGADPRTFPTIWNESADFIEQGFRLVGTRYFFSDGDFEKDDPFDDGNPDELVVRAIRVRVVGGGGGGGAAQATGATESSAGSGGGGGGYAESFITDIAGLASSVSVERGAGGAAGTTGAGAGGGSSSFGTLVVATGGEGGSTGVPRTAAAFSGDFTPGGVGTSGDLLVGGCPGIAGAVINAATPLGSLGGAGGGTLLGGAARNRRDSPGGTAGADGLPFGGGASGGANRASIATDSPGGAGANGVVIVEVFA